MKNSELIFSNNFLTINYNESNEDYNFNYLYFQIQKGTPTQFEWQEVLEFIIDLYCNYDQHCLTVGLIFNLNKLIYLSPKMLKQWSIFFIENTHVTNRIIIASSIILEKSIIKHFLNIFFTVYNPIKPLKFVKSEENAIQFIESVVQQHSACPR